MAKLLIISGSLRAQSSSRLVAHELVNALKNEADFTFAEIGKLPHYNADLENDEYVRMFIQKVSDADGIVFVTPEYNYSIPGVLKNAIDWASRPAYESVFKNKHCFIVSVSGGPLGGVRAQSHLKYVLNGMLANTHVGKEILVPSANAKINDGAFSDNDIIEFARIELLSFIGDLQT